jgi:ubiquinone/menaquinone biosynthesis C-methylase UbiE
MGESNALPVPSGIHSMPIDNTAFVGSIPENYDRYLGPVMFDPYARDLVERLSVSKGAAVLELACGTGIVTRRLRNRLPPTVQPTRARMQAIVCSARK